jgi:signal transduction histidine kinase
MKIGEDGYVFIFNTKGVDRGRYELSLNGTRDGEVVLDAKSADGTPIIREMIEKVESAPKGTLVTYNYQWKNGDEPLRLKIAKLVYYAPWDWAIGVSTYEDDYLAPVRSIQSANRSSTIQSILLSMLFAAVAGIMVAIIIRKTVKKVEEISLDLRTGAHETGHAARDVSAPARTWLLGQTSRQPELKKQRPRLTSLPPRRMPTVTMPTKLVPLFRKHPVL